MPDKEITQKVTIKASATKVYDAFMDQQKHAEFTGYPAQIENKVGGSFNVAGNYATGKNLELQPGKKIVQSWHASDWPEGVESKLTLVLVEENGVTTIKLTQSGVPQDFVKDVDSGWYEYYWEPLKKYLKNED